MEDSLSATNIGYIISFVFSLLLALVLVARSKRVSARIFFAIILCVSSWILSNYMADNAFNEKIALFWAKAALAGPILIAPLFLSFSIVFPSEDNKFSRRELIYSLLSSLPLLLLLPTSMNVKSIEFQEFGITFSPGPLYIIFVIYFAVCMVYSCFILVRKYRSSVGVFRSQIKLLGLGATMTVFVAILFTALMPLIGYSSTSFIGPLASLFLLTTATYALLRHKLFGIRFIIGKTVYIVLIALTPYGFFYLVFLLQTFLWGSVFSLGAATSGFFMAIGFVYFLLFANNRLTRFVNDKIINEGYDPQVEKEKFIKKLSLLLSLNEIAVLIMDLFGRTVAPEKKAVFVLGSKENKLLYQKEIGFESKVCISELKTIATKLESAGITRPIRVEQFDLAGPDAESLYSGETVEAKNLLTRLNASVLLTWNTEGKYIGVLILGRKKNLSEYSASDVEFLSSVLLDLKLATDRALLYSEVQEFNVKLQKEIEVATKKLKVQNEKLKELDKMKDDLISIAGHELRTPATIAKGNLHLLRKKINTPERDKYLERAIAAIEREAELVTILLEASRIGKDTLELVVEPLQLEELAAEAAEDHQPSANKKKLKLTFDPPKAPHSTIYGDKTRVREIMDNLITNAVKYTEKGSIKISTEEKGDKVWFHIQDTGVGIPEHEIPNLFQKFYRIKNYTSGSKNLLRPGGTGLGLYVSKNLAHRHGGDVTVQSKVGAGSIFSFYIPLSFKGNLGAVKDLPKDQTEADMFKVMGFEQKKKNSASEF